ncbi:MAG: hypothetical protein AB7K86_16000 [Rhodospirillales bacterium]
MPQSKKAQPAAVGGHGAAQLSAVTVDSYNLELTDEEGFIGDRASGRAFRAILDELRAQIRERGDDPLGKKPSRRLKKDFLDGVLTDGDPMAAGIVHGAIEEFAQQLAGVTRRFLRQKAWRDVERVVIGGGLRQSRVGEIAIGRAAVLLRSTGVDVEMQPLRHHPDEAGLIGCVHLAPSWIFQGFDSILAVDVGGTNIRCGVVRLNTHRARDLSKVDVWKFDLWRHGDESPSRDEAVKRLCKMLRSLGRRARRNGYKLAPFVGVGCPGVIDGEGAIERGDQNLPGKWSSSRFNLPHAIRECIPDIGGHDTVVVLHNDAVVQGLSAVPTVQDVTRWGVLTIGTGLGNASYTNRGD